jgi:hypothetical protein
MKEEHLPLPSWKRRALNQAVKINNMAGDVQRPGEKRGPATMPQRCPSPCLHKTDLKWLIPLDSGASASSRTCPLRNNKTLEDLIGRVLCIRVLPEMQNNNRMQRPPFLQGQATQSNYRTLTPHHSAAAQPHAIAT